MSKLYLVAGETAEEAMKVAVALKLPNPTFAMDWVSPIDQQDPNGQLAAAKLDNERIIHSVRFGNDLTLVCVRYWESRNSATDFVGRDRLRLDPPLPERTSFLTEQYWIEEKILNTGEVDDKLHVKYKNARCKGPLHPTHAIIDLDGPKLELMVHDPEPGEGRSS